MKKNIFGSPPWRPKRIGATMSQIQANNIRIQGQKIAHVQHNILQHIEEVRYK